MKANHPKFSSRGFTLVELLVVIAIIGVMLATLLPAVNGMREAARRSTCQNNVVRLMIALQDYQSAHESLPSGVLNPLGPIRNVTFGLHHGWLEQLLPYVDEQNIGRQIDFSIGVYEPMNSPVRKLRVSEFICPSEVIDDLPASSYAGCHHDVEAPIDADNHGVLFLNSHVSSDDIPDGAGHTIFVGEKIVTADDLGWTSGTRATLRNTGHRINTAPPNPAIAASDAPAAEGKAPAAEGDAPAAEAATPAADPESAVLYVGGFASHHPMGALFGLGDGNVRFIADEIDQTVFEQLGNRSDGALIDDQLLR
jgi:prepilin-type N-terminal cleavage/methylation domain-containing protein